jgi:putative ABC transport system substrate-binding protein
VPEARRIAALADPATVTPTDLQVLQSAGRARGVEVSILAVRSPEEIVPAVEQVKASGAAAINVLAAPLFSFSRRTLIEHTTALKLPAIYEWPDMAEDGGLMAYGTQLALVYRQTAAVVAKILRGAKPADIPVQQPTKFELVINLRAAKAINYTLPTGLVLRA